MFCSNCGAKAADGKFCPSCGAQLGAPVTAASPSASASPVGYAKTSTLAVVAFVSGFFIPLLGIVLGVVARKQIDRSAGREGGRGLATAAIWLNAIVSFFLVIGFASILFLASQSNDSGSVNAFDQAQLDKCAIAQQFGNSVDGCP